MKKAGGVRRAACERVVVLFIGHESALHGAIAATSSSYAHAARRMPHISRDNGEVPV
jgi:hypothetical protein